MNGVHDFYSNSVLHRRIILVCGIELFLVAMLRVERLFGKSVGAHMPTVAHALSALYCTYGGLQS
eukprot:18404-Heterococcus_DN1.PRE.2